MSIDPATPRIGLIIVGDEILSGRRQDKHFSKVVELLSARGLRLAWAEIMPDDRDALVAAYRRSFAGGDIVFSCGGIGATPDDHTRQAAAAALDVPLALHPDAEREITLRCVEMAAKGQGTTDMSTTLKTMAAAGPELIYMPLFIAEAGFLKSQIPTTTGLENVKTLGADGHYSADFLKAAGNAAVGHLQTSPNFSAFTGDYAGFLEKRAAKFGGDPLSAFHAQAYDATNMLFAALEKVAVVNADGSLSIPKGALRDAIFATKDFTGLTGTLSCTPTGDCGAPVIAVYEITQADVDAGKMPSTPIWP